MLSYGSRGQFFCVSASQQSIHSFCTWFEISDTPLTFSDWSNYEMGGRLQMIDILIASIAGLSLIVQMILVGFEEVEHLSACIFMVVAMVGTGYADVAKPHWDGNNGLILHLLLRFEAMCFVIGIARIGCSCSSGFTLRHMLWLLPFHAAVYVLHGLSESTIYHSFAAIATSEGPSNFAGHLLKPAQTLNFLFRRFCII